MKERVIHCPAKADVKKYLQETGMDLFCCGGNGSCGKCKGKVLSGDAGVCSEEENRWLTNDEKQQGIRLLCQIHAMTDLTLAVDVKNAEELPQVQAFGAEKQKGRTYGIAFDLGTTTLAAALFDRQEKKKLLEISAWNPQGVFGADIISRMQYCLYENGAKQMQTVLVNGMNAMIAELLSMLEKLGGGLVDCIAAAGNSAMTHFLLGCDISTLAKAPFRPAWLHAQKRKAVDCGFCVSEDATLVTLPLLGGQVGGDIMAALLWVDILAQQEGTLLVDLGTNGELVFFWKQKLYVCSTAAGPALEGGGICCGMRAKTGAVEAVWLTGGEIYTKVIGNQEPCGICGSGLIDMIAVLLKLGKIHEDGYLEGGAYDFFSGKLKLTQEDIRQFQMVKAAIRAGITALVRAAGADSADISKIYLAGALGSAIRKQNAIDIGLLPDVLADMIQAVGNASLHGTGLIFGSDEKWKQAEDIAHRAVLVDLTEDTKFQEEFIAQMNFDGSK